MVLSRKSRPSFSYASRWGLCSLANLRGIYPSNMMIADTPSSCSRRTGTSKHRVANKIVTFLHLFFSPMFFFSATINNTFPGIRPPYPHRPIEQEKKREEAKKAIATICRQRSIPERFDLDWKEAWDEEYAHRNRSWEDLILSSWRFLQGFSETRGIGHTSLFYLTRTVHGHKIPYFISECQSERIDSMDSIHLHGTIRRLDELINIDDSTDCSRVSIYTC